MKNKMKGTDRKYCGNSEEGVNRPFWDNLGKPPTGCDRRWESTGVTRWRVRERSKDMSTEARPRPRPFKRTVGRFHRPVALHNPPIKDFPGQDNVLNSQVNTGSK